MTASPAPPWSVPLSAPTPPTSDRVAAITRVVEGRGVQLVLGVE